jgi:RNA polymerase-binding transcription factor DksA
MIKDLVEKIASLPWDDFMQNQKAQLRYRFKNKSEILKAGGEQALSHSEKDLQRIEYALKRMENNSYGLCCNCGTSILKERLISIPETPFCLPCANEKVQSQH